MELGATRPPNTRAGTLVPGTLHSGPHWAGVTVLDVQGFPIRGSGYAVCPPHKPMPVSARTFIDFLREHARLLEPRR